MSRELRPEDVEGQTIDAVMQTEFRFEPDGYAGCRVFVRTRSGVTFELIWPDADGPLVEVDVSSLKLIWARLPEAIPSCLGETIVRVLRSELWPTIGLQLSSNRYLYMSNDYDFHLVGPCLIAVGGFYLSTDVSPYWPAES